MSYVHSLPGRLRVRIPAAKGNPIAAERLATKLNTLEGIQSVTANPVTGSILICYDSAATDAAACLAILNIPPIRKSPTSTRPQSSKLVEAMAWYVLEKSVERCFVLIISALL
jgi:Heavy metal associated domain 2